MQVKETEALFTFLKCTLRDQIISGQPRHVAVHTCAHHLCSYTLVFTLQKMCCQITPRSPGQGVYMNASWSWFTLTHLAEALFHRTVHT